MNFQINYRAPLGSGYDAWPLLVHETKTPVLDGSKVVFETKAPVTFVYDYPLSVTVKRVHKVKNGKWTRLRVARIIQRDYARIYREEDAADKVGMIPGMFNRDRSEGPYGIWGHVIEDLVIEGVNYNPKTHTITLSIGS